MSSWRDAVLKEFVPGVSRLTLVADPDNLLTEERLTLALRKRGFDLIEFDDPVAFRYAYESKYRAIWDKGEQTDLMAILRIRDTTLDALPHDLLQAGRKLGFNLGELFPNMSYSVLEELDGEHLDLLFDAQARFPPERMGDNATKDFVLRHVFSIAVELIRTEVDLLRTLLRIHYKGVRIPNLLSERVVQTLGQQPGFSEWPLARIIPDDNEFFGFLQERWPHFLAARNEGPFKVHDLATAQDFKFAGPVNLPFDHDDIKVYIDNLFLERRLAPVSAQGLNISPESWMSCGIIQSEADDNLARISGLFDLIEKERPTLDSNHSEWINFAPKWAELSALVHTSNVQDKKRRLQKVGDSLNTLFADWMEAHYAGLMNLPPTQPVMLHHVSRHLERAMESAESSKVALVVMDGLALDQWVTVREVLKEQDASLSMRESAAFAWVPTVTSVSRQAIFAGKPPLYFPTSIHTTNNEARLWRQFWEGCGLSRTSVAYGRSLGEGNPSEALEALIHPAGTRVAGLVVDMVDKIMHGMQLGAAGMHNQIRQWCQERFLVDLVGYLLDMGFCVWLTADHGNIECEGRGRPSEGAIAEARGERVRVYPTPELRERFAKSCPFARQWEPVGLPDRYFPLTAARRDAFVRQGEKIVGHGGLSIEEVIVPFVKLERK